MPFPIADIAIAGISALGDFLFGSSQDDGTKMTGRPGPAFAAQDNANRQIGSELSRAQAARGQPIALPGIDLSGTSLGQQVNIPGLDMALGIDPGLLGLGTQDFFGDINQQRADFNEQFPGSGAPVAVPRGSSVPRTPLSPDAGDPRGTAQDRAGESLGADDRGQQSFDNPDQTLDIIGNAIQELLKRTDASQIGPPVT